MSGGPTARIWGFQCRWAQRIFLLRSQNLDGVRLCDALPNIDFVMSLVLPRDVPQAVADRHQMEVMLNHTTKPIVFVTNDRASCQRAIDMAAAAAGSLPDSPVYPLKLAMEQARLAANQNPEAQGNPLAYGHFFCRTHNAIPLIL